ncbi:DUF7470 family protein [Halococcus hamelinensis]|uniref:Uncharacterized protein n=1 Tax=Halococcus hamelinensis 100A6 TaxID=1132509 RepID=M0M825_9EURY|nr:hypothetical protein [Halococcus hamelinensis]EMA40769.1 hypothetical protein C447_03206 [Halococcus hamelinensis 100A6]
MLGKLGLAGAVGVCCCLAGIGVIAYVAPVVAGGLALVLVGLVLVARGLLSGVLSAFGMDGMF